MTSSSTIAARLREADERILDPETIEAKLSALHPSQRSLMLKLYRAAGGQLNASEARMRRELIRLFKDTAREIEGDVFQTFSRLGDEGWDFNKVRRIGLDRHLLGQIQNRIAALGGRIEGSFQDGLLDQFKKAWVDAGHALDSVTPPDVTIRTNLLPDREILAVLDQSWSGARFSDRLGLITDDMAHKISHEILKSMMSSESWQETARRIRGEMGTTGQKSVWRAEMVARTELSRAQTVANQQLYSENDDVIEQVVWVTHPGACEDVCVPKHGEPVGKVGYPPGDSHPNCRCSILAVPKSWGELSDEPFSLKPQSKKSWAEDRGLGGTI